MNGDWGGGGEPLAARDYATMRWIILCLVLAAAAALWVALL